MDNSPHPLRLAAPTADYRIDPASRARVFRGYDADALERLLAHVAPERRAEILSYFLVPDETSAGPSRGTLIQIKDPELQSMLEEVWAPMWDFVGATDEDIAANTYGYPGREIARARRAEDVNTLLSLFSELPEGRRYAALDCFLGSWEAARKRLGYPRSERLDHVREGIRRTARDGAT